MHSGDWVSLSIYATYHLPSGRQGRIQKLCGWLRLLDSHSPHQFFVPPNKEYNNSWVYHLSSQASVSMPHIHVAIESSHSCGLLSVHYPQPCWLCSLPFMPTPIAKTVANPTFTNGGQPTLSSRLITHDPRLL